MEKNPRTWKIWFMDASKQAMSAGILHVLNLYLSHSVKSGDQCVWYFLNYTVDTILGMALCYLLLHSVERCLKYSNKFAFKSGYYGDDTNICLWVYQLWIWIGIILIVKGVIWIIMTLFVEPLQFFGSLLLVPFSGHPQLELIAVMILIPLILNSLVFWITDSFLKNDKEIEIETDLELITDNKRKMLV